MMVAGLRLDITKSKFHVQKVTFLGLLVSKGSIQIDSKKIEAVQDWAVPKSVKDIQLFILFANFYRRFIKNFCKVTWPMMELTWKNTSFI